MIPKTEARFLVKFFIISSMEFSVDRSDPWVRNPLSKPYFLCPILT